MTLRVALDHNFPIPIVEALADGIIEADLVPISRIDPRLITLDDHDVVRAVCRRGFDMLVSCDHDMFEVPRVLAAILQTRMSVVAVLGQGHDRVAAAGLVLAHLPHIVAGFCTTDAQLWKLRVGRHKAGSPWDELARIATRRGTSAKEMYETLRMSARELARDPSRDD